MIEGARVKGVVVLVFHSCKIDVWRESIELQANGSALLNSQNDLRADRALSR